MKWTPDNALYIDNGQRVTTHSMLKTFSRCPKQAQYKYSERLKPRFVGARDKPLRRGTWFHSLLEEYYAGRSWKAKHRELCEQFDTLFDEEKQALGDLPGEMATLMRSYLWHYGANKQDPLHGWTVHQTELTLECPWPDSQEGTDIYRCRLDGLVEDEHGLWIVDHKTHKRLPGMTQRLLDHASALYIWAAWENGLEVQGFIWNYIRTKAPSKPDMAYVGTARERLSVAKLDTDYPTFYRALRDHQANGHKGVEFADHAAQLAVLKSHRWQGPGSIQTSTFFRREILEKDPEMVSRIVAIAMRTRDRMHEYGWDRPDQVELVTDRSCEFMCSFNGLCETELFGGNADNIRRQQFRVGDPLDYYRDQKSPEME